MGKIGKGSIYFKPMDELVVDEYSLMGNSYDYDYTFTIAIDHEHTVDEMMSDQGDQILLLVPESGRFSYGIALLTCR